MGCGSSSSETNVQKDRRRLSVGHVEGKDASDEGGDVKEDERGLITQLNEANIVDMVAKMEGPETGRRMSVGSSQDQGKTSFANKTFAQIGDDVDTADCGLGYTCRKGLKPESPNQDAWFLLKMESFSIYAVFDGHGQKGHDVSQFAKENLPKLIIKDPRYKTNDIGACLFDSFKKVQGLILTMDRMKKLSAQLSGTTATVVVHNHKEKQLTFAHVADSTAVMGTKQSNGTWKGEAMTEDHKPNLKAEKARIEKHGGRVVFDGYANHRVYARGARYPGLNMSRCLGDLLGHQDCGISAEPETKTVKQDTTAEQVLLLCSDGVWEFIKPQEAVEQVVAFSKADAMKAAEALAKNAWDKWIKEEGGAVVDDITVVLVHLT
jgi:serine/threonine protein phosphatase PrpC